MPFMFAKDVWDMNDDVFTDILELLATYKCLLYICYLTVIYPKIWAGFVLYIQAEAPPFYLYQRSQFTHYASWTYRRMMRQSSSPASIQLLGC